MSKEQYRQLTEAEIVAKDPPNVHPPYGCVWVKTIFGRWCYINKGDRHVPHMDPSYETYWSM